MSLATLLHAVFIHRRGHPRSSSDLVCICMRCLWNGFPAVRVWCLRPLKWRVPREVELCGQVRSFIYRWVVLGRKGSDMTEQLHFHFNRGCYPKFPLFLWTLFGWMDHKSDGIITVEIKNELSKTVYFMAAVKIPSVKIWVWVTFHKLKSKTFPLFFEGHDRVF